MERFVEMEACVLLLLWRKSALLVVGDPEASRIEDSTPNSFQPPHLSSHRTVTCSSSGHPRSVIRVDRNAHPVHLDLLLHPGPVDVVEASHDVALPVLALAAVSGGVCPVPGASLG